MSQKQSYQHASFFRGVSLIVGALTMSLAISFAVLAWTGPSVDPPDDNASTPLNVSSTGQSKSGGLILNTGGAANGLIIDQGDVGIGVSAPGAKLDIAGSVKIVDGTQGAGKVLTDVGGTGLATWETAGGSPTTWTCEIITCKKPTSSPYNANNSNYPDSTRKCQGDTFFIRSFCSSDKIIISGGFNSGEYAGSVAELPFVKKLMKPK